jgi:hypothetical protein
MEGPSKNEKGRKKRKKKPMDNATKKIKNQLVNDQASLEMLDDNSLSKMMCKLDLKTLGNVASLNKRVHSIFISDWFFRECIEPYMSKNQLQAFLMRGHKKTTEHIVKGGDDYFTMTVSGETYDGVKYNMFWYFNSNGYADDVADAYNSGEDAEHYNNQVPEGEEERKQWFREFYEGQYDNGRIELSFTFPEGMSDLESVQKRVILLMKGFNDQFTEFLIRCDASRGYNGADNAWYLELIVRPFEIDITEESYDETEVVKVTGKYLKQIFQNRKKKKVIAEPQKAPVQNSEYSDKLLAFMSEELQKLLSEVEENQGISDNSYLEGMCKKTIAEAKDLLLKIESGEAEGDGAIDAIRRMQGLLMECLNLEAKYYRDRKELALL